MRAKNRRKIHRCTQCGLTFRTSMGLVSNSRRHAAVLTSTFVHRNGSNYNHAVVPLRHNHLPQIMLGRSGEKEQNAVPNVPGP